MHVVSKQSQKPCFEARSNEGPMNKTRLCSHSSLKSIHIP